MLAGDLAGARTFLDAARARFRDDPALLARHAETLYALGRLEELIGLAPLLVERGTLLSVELLLEAACTAADPVAARAACDRLRGEDPGNVGYALIDAALLHEAGRLRESHRILDDLARRHPDVPEVHAALGILLFRLGRAEEAERHLTHFLRVLPPDRRAEAAADIARVKGETRAPALERAAPAARERIRD